MSSVFLRLLRKRFLTCAIARLLFFREYPAPDDKIAYHMCDNGQDPRDWIGNVQREQRVIHTEHGEDPDDAEHAGAHYHDNGGNHAFSKTSGCRYGAVHERRHYKGKAHNTQSLHAGIYNLWVVGKQR